MKSVIKDLRRVGRVLSLEPQMILPRVKTRLLFLYSSLFKGYTSNPQTIYIGITKHCNLKCKMCDLGSNYPSFYSRRLSPSKDLPVGVWYRFIDEVSCFRPNIEICAAEPLLYADLGRLIKYIRKKGMHASIYTNGYLLEEKAIELIEGGICRINVSIDGVAELHDKIRQSSGLFVRICNGLKKLKSLSSANTPKIGINFTINEENFDCIVQTYEYLYNNGIPFDQFTIIHTLFISQDMADEHNLKFPAYPASPICIPYLDIDKIDPATVRNQIEQLLNKYPRKIRNYPEFDIKYIETWYHRPAFHLGTKRCLFIYNSANITSDGNVIPYIRCVEKTFGNIVDSSFKEIWNSEDFRKFRYLNASQGPFSICNRCSANFLK